LTNLYLLSLEPFEERYTGQWYRWLPESFGVAFDVKVIDGVGAPAAIEVGAFLDLNSTVGYKAAQMQRVADLFRQGVIQNGDVFWLSDIEFWGMEAIRYLARLQGIKVLIAGFLHAASYTTEDFMSPMDDIGRFSEVAWIATCDRVYVGSLYHKEAVALRRLMIEPRLNDRVVITGNPWRSAEALSQIGDFAGDRDIDVIFPHRPDHEKRPGVFLDLMEQVQRSLGPLRIVFTTGRPTYRSTNDPDTLRRIQAWQVQGLCEVHTGLSRADFYRLLRRSKVVMSTAIEENFGYAIVEGMTFGALPLLPDGFSYPELVQGDKRFLYRPERASDSLAPKLFDLLVADDSWRAEVSAIAREWDRSEWRIVNDLQSVWREMFTCT
jgi:glycosyltransferase involved in cell wall biosynthesis